MYTALLVTVEECLVLAACPLPHTYETGCERGCDVHVRLVGGANDILEGRVEVCYNSVWGTV